MPKESDDRKPWRTGFRYWLRGFRHWLVRLTYRLLPEWSNRRGLRRLERTYKLKIAAARRRGDSVEERDLKQSSESESREYSDALHEIASQKLLARARKRHLSFRDVPKKDWEEPTWERGEWGNKYLDSRAYDALDKIVRQAEREYAKERREVWEFRVKMLTAILTAITGIVGALIGLTALLKK